MVKLGNSGTLYFGVPNRKRNNAFQQPSNVDNNIRSYRGLISRFAGQKIRFIIFSDLD